MRAVRANKRTSEWPSADVPVLSLFKPQWNGGGSVGKLQSRYCVYSDSIRNIILLSSSNVEKIENTKNSPDGQKIRMFE